MGAAFPLVLVAGHLYIQSSFKVLWEFEAAVEEPVLAGAHWTECLHGIQLDAAALRSVEMSIL